MPGRALEVSVATGDIRRSFEFWTRLGFGSALTGDTWPHAYGVMTAPQLNLGLHAAELSSPLLTLVRPDVSGLVPLLEERGVQPEDVRLGAEVFNQLQFSDPAGLRVRVLEARTFSPPASVAAPVLGRFEAVSWPVADAIAIAGFWRRLHVDCAGNGDDWAELRADIGGQAVAWHSPRVAKEPLLVFRHGDIAALGEELARREVPARPRALGLAAPHLLLTSPEGQKVAILA